MSSFSRSWIVLIDLDVGRDPQYLSRGVGIELQSRPSTDAPYSNRGEDFEAVQVSTRHVSSRAPASVAAPEANSDSIERGGARISEIAST